MKITSSSDYQRELDRILDRILPTMPLGKVGQSSAVLELFMRHNTALKEEATQAILDLNDRALPEEESYDDFEYGSHGDGWNDCLQEVKSILSKPIKESDNE